MAVALAVQLSSPPVLQAALHHPDPSFIRNYAKEVFGDSQRAGTWLRSSNSSLGKTSPQRRLASGDAESMRQVLRLLIQLDYGVQA